MRSRLSTVLTVIILVLAVACGSSSPGSGDSGSPSGSSSVSSATASGSSTFGGTGTSGSSSFDSGSSTTPSGSSSSGSGGASSSGSSSASGVASSSGSSAASSGSGSSSTASSGSSSTGDGGASPDGGSSGEGGACSASSVVTYPALPGAVQSPLYKVTANGTTEFVEQLTKFTPEMQVHYAHFSVQSGCTATIAVTLSTSFTSYTVSPKSRNIAVAKSGNTITFSSGPNYLILQFDSQALLFILIDPAETSPPQLGDADVKNIMDYGVDATGATLMTSKIQSAIN